MTLLANQMTDLSICCTHCGNFLFVSKDKLVDKAPIKSSNMNTLILVVFCIPTFASILASSGDMYTNMDLQKATKLAIKFFIQDQAYAQGSKSREKSLKICFPNLY